MPLTMSLCVWLTPQLRLRLQRLQKACVSYSAENANFQTTFLLPRETDNFLKKNEFRTGKRAINNVLVCLADPTTTTAFTALAKGMRKLLG